MHHAINARNAAYCVMRTARNMRIGQKKHERSGSVHRLNAK